MTTYGISATGFVPKPVAEIQTEIQNALKAQFGQEINLSSASVFGQLVALMSQPLADAWALAQAVYAAAYPATASGQQLDNICQLSGTTRLQPTYSTVTVTLTGTNGTVVPLGTVFSVLNTGNKFQTTVAVTIGAGPTPVACQSVALGPIPAPAGTLVNIDTPVTGLTGVTNALNATLGSALETDAALRLRRQTALRGQGTGTVNAVTAALQAVPGIGPLTVFENVTDFTDSFGNPPHSINCVITPGTATAIAIATAIFNNKPAGVNTSGSATGGTLVSQVVVDQFGVSHIINWETPGVFAFYVSATLVTNPLTFPVNGDAQVQAALNAYAATLPVGATVYRNELFIPIFSIPGVLDVTSLTLGTSPSPVGTTNLVAPARALPSLPIPNIVITP